MGILDNVWKSEPIVGTDNSRFRLGESPSLNAIQTADPFLYMLLASPRVKVHCRFPDDNGSDPSESIELTRVPAIGECVVLRGEVYDVLDVTHYDRSSTAQTFEQDALLLIRSRE